MGRMRSAMFGVAACAAAFGNTTSGSAAPASLQQRDGVVFALNGGSVGGGAVQSAQIVSYLRRGGALPKLCVGSSIGALQCVILQQAAAAVKGEGAAALRSAMIESLEQFARVTMPHAGIIKGVIDFFAGASGAKPDSKVTALLDLAGIQARGVVESELDIAVAVTDQKIGASELLFNDQISRQVLNASAAHHGVNPVNGKIDGNYGPWLSRLAERVTVGQRIVFFNSYDYKNLKINATQYTAGGLADLRQKGAYVTECTDLVTETDRHQLGLTRDLYDQAVENHQRESSYSRWD
jgi:hypothetical protein